METREGWIALNMVEGIGPARAHRLVQRFGSPGEVFLAGQETLQEVVGINESIAERIRQGIWAEQVEKELERCQRVKCRILTLADEEYPTLLRTIALPPPVLYVRGEFTPADIEALAIVGCRHPNPYGLQAAWDFAQDLAGCGFTIVSGLAYGIDTQAHHAALDAGGRTVAVLAHGLDRVYPAQNRGLHDRVISGSGAVVSEFPLGTPPKKENFPQRNRIISGLAKGVLVIEAGLTSGALITARWAVEQGREVFALPGPYSSRLSQGAHALIQDGAKLVTTLDDVLEELIAPRLRTAPNDPGTPASLPNNLTAEQKQIIEILESGEKHLDQLAVQCGLAVPQLLSDLLRLEMQGWVRALPGRMYCKRERAGQ